jgi:hypothetical protein
MTRTMSLAAIAVLCACGGQVTTDAGDGAAPKPGGGGPGGDGSAGGSDAATTPDSPIVASEASTGVTCISGPSSGTGSSGGCQTAASETCSDGNTYQVSCSCPAATCTCTQSSANSGSGGGGIPFSGCPSCGSTTDLFSVCGFPQ